MNTQQNVPVSTETKVTLAILAFTAVIIMLGVTAFKKSNLGTSSETDSSKYIQTGLTFAKETVSPAVNPKVTGTGSGTATSSNTTPIEITEFMDYECPACAINGEVLVKQLLETYGSRVVITRRVFPVHGEPAIKVAQMVLAAQDVSNEAYQKLHAKVLETQGSWSRLGTSERVTFFKKLTADLGLDYDTLVTTGASKYASQIDKDTADARALGIKATPSFIVNNTTRVTGGVPLEYLTPYIDMQ